MQAVTYDGIDTFSPGWHGRGMRDSLPFPDAGVFLTTRWSRVVMAGETSGPDAEAALADLCRGYWTPIYSFARRAGHSREDAQDLTQGFFLDLLTRNSIAGAARERGRFRSFLLGAFEHYRANCYRRESAQKRGGRADLFSMDAGPAEAALAMEASTSVTAETVYERSWAMALLAKVMERLKGE
jgi:DNA-directed RNA polymerase specialized sigma24 family protein